MKFLNYIDALKNSYSRKWNNVIVKIKELLWKISSSILKKKNLQKTRETKSYTFLTTSRKKSEKRSEMERHRHHFRSPFLTAEGR